MMDLPAGGSTIQKPGPAAVIMSPAQEAEVSKIYSLADLDPVGRYEGMWYGPPGSGKTTTVATMPGPIRWIDADGGNGLKSILWAYKAGLTALTSLADIRGYKPAESWEGQYVKDPRALDKMADMLTYWFSPTQVDLWKTLCIDSATEVNMWCIYKGLHLNGMLPTASKPLSNSDKINEQAKTLLLTGEQDYKSAMGLFTGTLTDIRLECERHGKNLILTSHEWQDTRTNPDGSQTVLAVRPWLIGQLRERVVKDFDDVWHFQIWNGKEVKVQVQGDPTHICKTRWGQVIGPTEEPDFRKIVAKVKAFHGIK